MNIKKLLAAVSIAALTATNASALTLTKTSTDFNTPLADELDLANDPVVGTFMGDMTLTSLGNYPAGTVLQVTATFPAGVTFASTILGTAVVTSGPGAHTPANGSVTAGGSTSDSFVTFDVGVPTSPNTTDTLSFTFPIAVADCANLANGLTITAVRDTGSGTSAIEGDDDGANAGVFGTAFPLSPICGSAWNGQVTNDETTSDTTIALVPAPTYTTLNEAGVPVALNTGTPLGTTGYAIDPTFAVDAAGTPMVAGDVDDVIVSVTAGSNASGALAITATPAPAAPISFNAPNNWIITLTGAEALTGISIDVETDGSAPILSQDMDVDTAQVNFNQTIGAPEFILLEPGATGDIDRLQRDGQIFGWFDWNGGHADGTISVYRFTGLPANSSTVYTVTLANAHDADGNSVTGVYQGTAVANGAGEVVLNSIDFGAGVPSYQRADVLITFETNDNLDGDRLMARNGIVTAFNDGSNNTDNGQIQTPQTDADQDRLSE